MAGCARFCSIPVRRRAEYRVLTGFDCDAVVLDNRAAMAEAVAHRLVLGHRRIGLVAAYSPEELHGARAAGGLPGRAGEARAGLPEDTELVELRQLPKRGSPCGGAASHDPVSWRSWP